MPPKKKRGKKKSDDGQTVEEKYKKTLEEIDALKDNLVGRREWARRAQSASQDWKSRMEASENHLLRQEENQRAVTADMSRQYKVMQVESDIRIHQLETEVAHLRLNLESTLRELKQVKEDKERMEREKNEQIAFQQQKIDMMGAQYEHAMLGALENLQDKIKKTRLTTWHDQSTKLQAKHKELLFDFGINPLDF